MADQWEPGKEYAPGVIVRPRAVPLTPVAITDPGLEAGGGSWVRDAGVTVSVGNPHTGSFSLACSTVGPPLYAYAAAVDCGPFHKVTAWCMVTTGSTNPFNNATVIVRWLDAALAVIRTDALDPQYGVAYTESRFSTVGPKNAAKVQIGVRFNLSVAGTSYADDFAWALEASGFKDLLFKATQAAPQTSGNSEPTWPTTVGATVADGLITWTAVATSRIAWKVNAVMNAGSALEPTWPAVDGGTVVDGQIIWRAFTRQVTDENCPRSPIVVGTSAKIFVGDNDIIRYCATNGPLDWTATQDAGFLPFGQGEYGSNSLAALGLYRGNIAAFNGEAFQMWQPDPDPQNMAKIDELPIGTTRHRALVQFANDLALLTSQGIRTIGIAGGSTNLQAGDIGMPIDPLIQAAVAQLDADGEEALGTYYPNAGQAWFAFPQPADERTEVFVYTMTRVGSVGAWSRYIFPFLISAFAQKGEKQYLRAGDDIIGLDEALINDYDGDVDEVPVVGSMQWNWLDFGRPGGTKMLEGFDIVGTGAADIEVGWDQTNLAAFTAPYTMPADSLPGQMVPFALSAPSFSIRLTYSGAWEFNALNVYLSDFGGAP